MENKMDILGRLFGLASSTVCVDCCVTTPHIDAAYTEFVETAGGEAIIQEMANQGVRYIKTDLNGVDLFIDEIDSLVRENEGEMSIQCWLRSNGDVEFIILNNDVMSQAYSQAEDMLTALASN